jgi:hypothetical protein
MVSGWPRVSGPPSCGRSFVRSIRGRGLRGFSTKFRGPPTRCSHNLATRMARCHITHMAHTNNEEFVRAAALDALVYTAGQHDCERCAQLLEMGYFQHVPVDVQKEAATEIRRLSKAWLS